MPERYTILPRLPISKRTFPSLRYTKFLISFFAFRLYLQISINAYQVVILLVATYSRADEKSFCGVKWHWCYLFVWCTDVIDLAVVT